MLMMESANHVSKHTKFELPHDLIPAILTELPVKSLLRFRCVSKSWNSVISDPEFSKLQLKPPCLLLYMIEEEPFRFTTLNLANSCEDSVDVSWRRNNYGYCEILGSCNGLIFVREDCNDLIVWNPSTRKFKPVTTDHTGYTGISCFGFGYDKSADDYKLVRADPRNFSTGIPRTEFYVLQLKSHVWRKIPDTNFRIKLGEHGVLLDGALHWPGYDWQDFLFSRTFIVVLDLATEKFNILLLPELDDHSSNKLSTIGGFLCLCSKSKSRERDGPPKIDVWIMKEYGVKSSWTKLFTIPPEIVDRYGYYVGLTPLLFSGEDEIVAIINGSNGAGLVRFNIKSLEFEDIFCRKVSPLLILHHIFLHTESLVSI